MRLIDADRLKEVFSRNVVGGNAYFDLIDNAPTVEAIPKADYETRLKANMVALLEDLKADIEAKTNYYEKVFKEPSNLIYETAMCGRMFGCGECKEIIQQKINELKTDQEGEE